MISSFEIPFNNVEDFTSKVKGELSSRPLGKIVQFSHQGEVLSVSFSKLGKSTVTYRVGKHLDGHKARLVEEKIAFAHKAFKGEIIGKITRLLERHGAKID